MDEKHYEQMREQINYMENSFSWRFTKPLRIVMRGLKLVKQKIKRAFKLFFLGMDFLFKHGVKDTYKRTKMYFYQRHTKRNSDQQVKIGISDEQIWNGLREWIENTPHEFIDIFHVPMGWNTPLFQRFQHMSLQAGSAGGISFYGAHPAVDKNLDFYEFVSPTLCIINLYNENVRNQLFKILDMQTCLKIIRLQSIDLATTFQEMDEFLNKGYEIVYEYIDEISPDITGDIPEFVYERHKKTLQDENILVVATSDKLYNQALSYRHKNILLSSNGVDYSHWCIEKNIGDAPEDLIPIVTRNKIIIGYHGALAKWIDYDLLAELAKDGRYVILLIGHAHDETMKKSKIVEHENVYYLGAKNYNELNKYTIFYDIGILPFIISDLTLSVSPVKIFEYMAAGKPVVSYALPECRKYRSCLSAENKTEFIKLVERANLLSQDENYLKQLKEDALNNTWQAITKNVFEKVNLLSKEKKKEAAQKQLLNEHAELSNRNKYIEDILINPKYIDIDFKQLTTKPYERKKEDAKIIAYYLTQFHPDAHNEEWWGKGVTEWNNVSRAVPQYAKHYQPRLPGELGFYDLRIRDNMMRQIELAKMYGVYGFSFYYYWFNGERLLEKPLEAFLNDKTLDFPFCICWANENWTKKFDGTNSGILIEQPKSYESYCDVIHDMSRFLNDSRYIEIDGKKLVVIYRPSLIPKVKSVLQYWRKFCNDNGYGELYVIAVKEVNIDIDWLEKTFDAVSEFHPGTIYHELKNITNDIELIRKDFGGEIFSYSDIVYNKKYFNYNSPKLYKAVMPSWDNTARRDNSGMIFEGSTPNLYKTWLKDMIKYTNEKDDLDDKLIFINAWNEWGEGAYLEPDKRYGYAYLEATKNALEEMR